MKRSQVKDGWPRVAVTTMDSIAPSAPALTLLLVVGLLTSALCWGAAESKTDDGPWVSLFNGADFTGWKIVALTNPALAVVEDGAMVLRQRTNTIEHTFVTAEKKYGDFILELDRIAP